MSNFFDKAHPVSENVSNRPTQDAVLSRAMLEAAVENIRQNPWMVGSDHQHIVHPNVFENGGYCSCGAYIPSRVEREKDPFWQE